MSHFLTQSPWVERTGWVLVHSLWQFALVAMIAGLLQWTLRRRSSVLRYIVLLVAMSIVVALPAVTWFAIGPIEPPVRAGVPALAGLPDESRLKPELPRDDFPPRQFADELPIADPPPAGAANPPAVAIPSPPEPHAPVAWWAEAKSRLEPWLPAVVLIWIAGVALFAIRPLASWYTVRRLRTKGASSVADSVREVLTRTSKRLRLPRAVSILQSRLVKTPVVIGYFRPLVLLPVCVVTGLPESQLELILAHELAHIRRHDYLVNLLQTLIETLFFYHPAVWWLSRRIRHERENCCDDIALSLTANRADYGRALLAIEQLRAASPVLSLAAGGGSLVARIRRIAAREPAPRASGGAIIVAFLASMALLAAATWAASPPLNKPAEVKPSDLKIAADPAATTNLKSQKEAASDAKAIEERAKNTKSAAWGYRHRRHFLADGGQLNLVGLLVTNGYWQKSLPLAPAQAKAIVNLDDLIQEAFDDAALVAADYMDTNPPDYHEYNARLNKRLNKAVFRAERMVALGLLTEPQAAFVMQRHLTNGSTGSRLYPLRDENVQELLGMTPSQISGLDKVGAEANRREAPLNLWTIDPKEQESVRRSMEANAKWLDEAAMNVLTPEQRALWSRLAAERHLPATPPDLPAPSAAELARIKVDEVSPVFRLLAEKADEFKLSDKQKKLLDRLKEITREGLFWIDRAKSKNASEFIKQAEQVALPAILTEKQAASVTQLVPSAAIKSKVDDKTTGRKPTQTDPVAEENASRTAEQLALEPPTHTEFASKTLKELIFVTLRKSDNLRKAGVGVQSRESNDIVIERKNNDTGLAELEARVDKLLFDVENNYWELWFAYRNLDAAVEGRDDALRTWQKANSLYLNGPLEGSAACEAQALEHYYGFRNAVEQAQSQLYDAERRLHFTMGTAATDGRLIRPKDDPATEKVAFDWQKVVSEALSRSPEIRVAKWRVKQREVERSAAEEYARSHVDSEKSRNEVANASLALERERAKLAETEKEVVNQLSFAVSGMDAAYKLSFSNFNRRAAGKRQLEAVQSAYDHGLNGVTFNDLLNAQQRLAQSESDYYRSITNYAKAISLVHKVKGTLLEHKGVYLADVTSDKTPAATPADKNVAARSGESKPPETRNGTSRDPVRVNFVGNRFVSDEKLKPLLSGKTDEDVAKLTAFYRGFGYFHVRIGHEVGVNQSDKRTTITFVIDEGPRYSVRNVSIAGNESLAKGRLAEKLKLRSGQPFDNALQELDLKSLRNEYRAGGFMSVTVTADIRILKEPDELDIVYNIDEGSPANASDSPRKTSGATLTNKLPNGNDWSGKLNGVRVRLLAPNGTTYRHGAILPLVVEVQNYGDKPIPTKTLWQTVRFLAHDSDGKWIGIPAMGPEMGGWVGQADLAPGKTAELRLSLQSLRFLRPLKAGETIQLQASAPTQTPRTGQLPLEVLTPPLSVRIQDAFPPDVGDADFPTEWKTNLACELNRGLLGTRRLQVDERGAAKLLNAYQVNGRRINNCLQVTLPPERLKKLAAALRELQAWKLSQVPKDIPYPDEGYLHLSLVCPSGASVVGEYASHLESTQPIVRELRKIVEGLIGDVEKTAKASDAMPAEGSNKKFPTPAVVKPEESSPPKNKSSAASVDPQLKIVQEATRNAEKELVAGEGRGTCRQIIKDKPDKTFDFEFAFDGDKYRFVMIERPNRRHIAVCDGSATLVRDYSDKLESGPRTACIMKPGFRDLDAVLRVPFLHLPTCPRGISGKIFKMYAVSVAKLPDGRLHGSYDLNKHVHSEFDATADSGYHISRDETFNKSGPRTGTIFTAQWKRENDVWYASAVTREDWRQGAVDERWEVKYTEFKAKPRLPEDAFSITSLHLQPGSTIVDLRPGLSKSFSVGDPADLGKNKRTIAEDVESLPMSGGIPPEFYLFIPK